MEQITKSASAKELVNKFEAFVVRLDCYQKAAPGRAQISSSLQAVMRQVAETKKKLYFVSNNDLVTREEYLANLTTHLDQASLPLRPTENDVYPASYLSAQYLKHKYPSFTKVWYVGNNSLKTELENAGFTAHSAGTPDPFNDEPISIDKFNNYPMVDGIEACVIGLDQQFNYTKLCLASLYIQNMKAKFICTNNDPYIPIANRHYPGTGSAVEAIQLTLNDERGSQL